MTFRGPMHLLIGVSSIERMRVKYPMNTITDI